MCQRHACYPQHLHKFGIIKLDLYEICDISAALGLVYFLGAINTGCIQKYLRTSWYTKTCYHNLLHLPAINKVETGKLKL